MMCRGTDGGGHAAPCRQMSPSVRIFRRLARQQNFISALLQLTLSPLLLLLLLLLLLPQLLLQLLLLRWHRSLIAIACV